MNKPNAYIESPVIQEEQEPTIPKDVTSVVDEWGNRKRLIHVLIRIGCFLLALGVVVIVAVTFVNTAYQKYIQPVDNTTTTQIEVTIESGSNLTTISELLEEKGIIRSATAFKFYADFSDSASKLLAGTYMLSPNMTFDDIISILKKPNSTNSTNRLTFIEGVTVPEIAKQLVKSGFTNNELSFLKATSSLDNFGNYWFIQELEEQDLSKRKYALEGYLFPDTYEFLSSSSPNTIIKKLLNNFNSVYSDTYAARANDLGMTTDQVITLASIIEKEAKKDDFAKVSAVFHNRLKEKMKLESCATLQYVKNERRLVWSEQELNTDSPYNTYLYAGLPAGPICNPSRAAIEAALNPDPTMLKEGYLFFCLGDPASGELFFAKTYEEHLANREKYMELWKEYDNKLKTGNN